MGAAVSIASTLSPDSVRLLDRSSCLAQLMPVRCATTPAIEFGRKTASSNLPEVWKTAPGMSEKGPVRFAPPSNDRAAPSHNLRCRLQPKINNQIMIAERETDDEKRGAARMATE
jgi:hypothetical protein